VPSSSHTEFTGAVNAVRTGATIAAIAADP
jgi:hypothetical protein